MKKYKKRPIVIEAIQLKNNDNSIIEAVEFVYAIGMESSLIGMRATIDKVRSEGGFSIKTLEGEMFASFNDYIIKGIKEEFYPCKPDIFEQTYELAE